MRPAGRKALCASTSMSEACSRSAEAEAEGLVCTVGQIIAAPGASNVIAGVVNFTIDIRARRDSVREGEFNAAALKRCAHSPNARQAS